MEKIELRITKKEIQVLNQIRLKNDVLKERQKAGAIYWRALGKTENQIHEITGLAVVTIIRHVKKYNELGLGYLKENNYKGNVSDLDRYSELIISDFNNDCPKTIAEASKRIEKLTGIKRSATSIVGFLKKKDFHTKSQEAYQQKRTKKSKKNS